MARWKRFLFLMGGMVVIIFLPFHSVYGNLLTFSHEYLMSDDFVYEWGPGSNWCKIDEGTSVSFGMIAPSGDLINGTGIGDNYEISPLSGGGLVGGNVSYSDFSSYDTFKVKFENNSITSPVWVTLFMNVNWGTYEESGWTYFDPNENKVITWDISALADRDKVGNIGFQVADFSGSTNCANISVTPVPVPGTLWLLGSGLLSITGINRRKIC